MWEIIQTYSVAFVHLSKQRTIHDINHSRLIVYLDSILFGQKPDINSIKVLIKTFQEDNQHGENESNQETRQLHYYCE